MRLLQTMAGAHHGGAEAFFERLAMGLQRTGLEQRLIIRRDADRAARLLAEGIAVNELPFGGMFDFRTRAGLSHAIRDFKPDVVLSWMNRATKFTPKGDFVHVARLGGYYDLKYYKHCDHLIGNTRGIVDYIRRNGWPADRVHYLPNFVTDKKAVPVPRESLAIPAHSSLAIALGRLHPNKGFDVLLAALAHLPRFHLWLAGEGPERKALQKQARDLGISERVHFLGWRTDTAALMGAADMFICSSRHEPLGNVVIEAWAAGIPVIAAEADGPRELIRHNEDGFLIPIDDVDILADAMQHFASDPPLRARLAAAGRASYEAEFSEARVVGLYREFFEKITAEKTNILQ